GAAKAGRRSFTESLRLPALIGPARLRVERRVVNRGSAFETLCEARVDPRDAETEASISGRVVKDLSVGTSSEDRVNVLFVAEGYGADESGKVEEACGPVSGVLVDTEPYGSFRQLFNVRAVFAPSSDSGISDPAVGSVRRTFAGATYGSFGLDRYVLPFDDAGLRRMVGGAPCDALVLVCNS